MTVKTMDPQDFLDDGYVQEINRLLLHPVGLALGLSTSTHKIVVQDFRDDPTGVVFDPEMDLKTKAETVLQAYNEHMLARVQTHGFVIQPITPDEEGDELCLGCGQPLPGPMPTGDPPGYSAGVQELGYEGDG